MVTRLLWEQDKLGSIPRFPTQVHGSVAQTAERPVEARKVGISEFPGPTMGM
jgi:hypothetical protein